MKALWRFEEQRFSQKSRDPVQAGFFSSTSIEDNAHALIREAIQNTLDANLQNGKPVKVRIHIGTHPSQAGIMDKYIDGAAWKHFLASDNGLPDPPSPTDECRYLVYEDFNTKGLTGDETAYTPIEGNSFYYFMRAEGKSDKQEEDRGRHGIGKYVFPYISNIRSFFMATSRADDKRHLVAGQAVLKTHIIDDKRYTPDGWWGMYKEYRKTGDYFPLPIEDLVTFNTLAKDFALQRTHNQSGLSLIMPYVNNNLNCGLLLKYAIQEYFYPILKKELIVEISEGDREAYHVTSDTVSDILDSPEMEKCHDKKSEGQYTDLKNILALAKQSLDAQDQNRIEIDLPNEKERAPRFNKDYLSEEKAKEIREALANSDKPLIIRCPLYVKPKKSKNSLQKSHFDILIAKDENDRRHKPVFIREGITIPEDKVPRTAGYYSLVVIERGPLATLLGDSENPAHTEWEKNADKFRGKYNHGTSTIDFVRFSVRNLVRLLTQADSEADYAALADIFFLDLPEDENETPPSRRKQPGAAEGSGKEVIPPADLPPSRPTYHQLNQSAGGFILKGVTNDMQPHATKRFYRIRLAYDSGSVATTRTALNRWDKNDFDLSKSKYVNAPVAEKVEDFMVDVNTLTFIAKPTDFYLSVDGFDQKRDLIISIRSKEVVDA